MNARLISHELTHDERAELEEGTRCSAGLRCVGLTIGNLPAHVGWYLDVSEQTGGDIARWSYGWRFDGHPGIYCEDCTLQIEADDAEFHGVKS